jgi:hypothetical protein
LSETSALIEELHQHAQGLRALRLDDAANAVATAAQALATYEPLRAALQEALSEEKHRRLTVEAKYRAAADAARQAYHYLMSPESYSPRERAYVIDCLQSVQDARLT